MNHVNHGFISTPSMGDIHRLQNRVADIHRLQNRVADIHRLQNRVADIHRLENRVAALELVVGELLTALYQDGTMEKTEYEALCERLGI